MPLDVVLDPKSPPSLEVSNAQLDEITALALAIAQAHAGVIEAGGASAMMAPYAEQPERRKADMRARTLRTIQALVMLGWIEKP